MTIVRDKYDVPPVSSLTHAGGVWASGWIAAEDRGLLLSQATLRLARGRHRRAGAERDRPDRGSGQLHPVGPDREGLVNRQTQVLLKAGLLRRATRVLRDIDTFIQGINAYNAIHNPTEAKFTRVDIYAFNALKDQFFGEGGGNQAQNAEFLLGPRASAREQEAATACSTTCARTPTPAARRPSTEPSTTTTTRASWARRAACWLKPGSFKPTTYASKKVTGDLRSLEPRPHASNELMVEGKDSATGHPLLVGGIRRSATSILA